MLHQRIAIFMALPIRSLDQLSLQRRLEGDRPHGRRNGQGRRADLMPPLARRLAAEALGTAFLLAAVVGSGIMAQKLAGGNVALALLGNTLPTGAMLAVLILIFGPISGAHFNPAVSLALALRARSALAGRGALRRRADCRRRSSACGPRMRCSSCRVWQVSTTARSGAGQWLAEFIATFGLVLTILGCVRARAGVPSPYAVGLYITAPTGSRHRPPSQIRP